MQVTIVAVICIQAAAGTFIIHKILAYITFWDKGTLLNLRQRDKWLLLLLFSTVIHLFFSMQVTVSTSQVIWVAYLLVMAITDAQSGYVYTSISIWMNVMCGIALFYTCWQEKILISYWEWILIWAYLFVIMAAGITKAMGEGDIPIFTALLGYYLLYASYPGVAVSVMFFLTQVLFCAGNIRKIGKRAEIPLVPYIAIAHVVTVCIFV